LSTFANVREEIR